MKINELVPFKSTPAYKATKDQLQYDKGLNRPTRTALITKKLESLGYQLGKIGSGAYAEVFKRPQDNYVIKLFTNDPAYLAYLKFMLSHQNNPHVPKTKGKLIKPFKDYSLYVVRMEVLIPKSWGDADHEELVAQIDRAINGEEDAQRALGKKYPHILEIVTGIDKLTALDHPGGNRGFMNDVHEGNIMYRGDGTPVITDPLF